jgi:hypothetical protein
VRFSVVKDGGELVIQPEHGAPMTAEDVAARLGDDAPVVVYAVRHGRVVCFPVTDEGRRLACALARQLFGRLA